MVSSRRGSAVAPAPAPRRWSLDWRRTWGLTGRVGDQALRLRRPQADAPGRGRARGAPGGGRGHAITTQPAGCSPWWRGTPLIGRVSRGRLRAAAGRTRISDLILVPARQPRLRDVRTIMSGMGLAMMGTGTGKVKPGARRAQRRWRARCSTNVDRGRARHSHQLHRRRDLVDPRVEEAARIVPGEAAHERRTSSSAPSSTAALRQVRMTVIATGFRRKKEALGVGGKVSDLPAQLALAPAGGGGGDAPGRHRVAVPRAEGDRAWRRRSRSSRFLRRPSGTRAAREREAAGGDRVARPRGNACVACGLGSIRRVRPRSPTGTVSVDPCPVRGLPPPSRPVGLPRGLEAAYWRDDFGAGGARGAGGLLHVASLAALGCARDDDAALSGNPPRLRSRSCRRRRGRRFGPTQPRRLAAPGRFAGSATQGRCTEPRWAGAAGGGLPGLVDILTTTSAVRLSRSPSSAPTASRSSLYDPVARVLGLAHVRLARDGARATQTAVAVGSASRAGLPPDCGRRSRPRRPVLLRGGRAGDGRAHARLRARWTAWGAPRTHGT